METQANSSVSNHSSLDQVTENIKDLNLNKEATNQDQTKNPPSDFENSDSEESRTESEQPLGDHPDDYIDENELEDLEAKLSSEEKSDRHKKTLALKDQGNEEFKKEHYMESINCYTEGLKLCPLMFGVDRSRLYANRAACKVKLNRKESAIEDCTKAIELDNSYEKAYLRRAKLYEESDKLDESLADYNKVLEFNPRSPEAIAAQHRLCALINERNEKLKTEMLGKLKDLGNVILRPFGLSTDSFQISQDPNTGGYSVNFKQNTQ
ncbi:tetratricopeptide repeat protein 1 [Euwallacea fornicatus]|uniref:tetratricopeptide repeat protein 1 n=1 Tax=Euwallacea fornicatus TaxID=995702 RepID=UPI00338DD066